MKTKMNIWIAAIALIIGTGTLNAQPGKYHMAMGKAFGQMGKAENAEGFVQTAATFERIMESAETAEEKYWPRYYAALNLIIGNWQMSDIAQRDQVLDKALDLITPVLKEQPNDDEFETLRGYALMAKLSANPQERGQSYSPMVFESFGKAMGMNPNNPRPMALMARQQLGTAQFFGSKPDEACALAERSLGLFDAEQKDGYAPRWGRDMAVEVSAACK